MPFSKDISESTMSFVRQALTFSGAMLTGLGITSIEQAATLTNELVVAIPALVSIGSVIWSIVSHYGKKKVPLGSTAVDLPYNVSVPPVGSNLNLTPLQGNAMVVG